MEAFCGNFSSSYFRCWDAFGHTFLAVLLETLTSVHLRTKMHCTALFPQKGYPRQGVDIPFASFPTTAKIGMLQLVGVIVHTFVN